MTGRPLDPRRPLKPRSEGGPIRERTEEPSADPSGSRRGRWNVRDWIVAGWIVFLDWVFDVAQWAISNVVPAFKNGTVQGAVLAGVVFGLATLVLRLLRDNGREEPGGVFPLTPPNLWEKECESRFGFPEGEGRGMR